MLTPPHLPVKAAYAKVAWKALIITYQKVADHHHLPTRSQPFPACKGSAAAIGPGSSSTSTMMVESLDRHPACAGLIRGITYRDGMTSSRRSRWLLLPRGPVSTNTSNMAATNFGSKVA